MALNFMDALDTNLADVERPPNLPIGNYIFMVTKYELGERESDKGSWDTLDFQCQIVAPTADVDEDDLASYGDVTKRSLRHGFMFDRNDKASFDKTMFYVRRFLEDHLRVDGAGKMTLKEALANCVNHQFMGTVKWRADARDASGESKFDEIGRTAPTD